MTPSEAAALHSDGMEALLRAIYERYHYDFRCYARGSLSRSIDRARAALGAATIPLLTERVSNDPAAFAELLRYLTIQVSELFRDPAYYRALRVEVLPHLATYPSLRIWIAGCGTGEEAYSLAIVLREEGLIDRSLIYATDIDAPSLAIARAGIYDIDRLGGLSENYLAAGGRASLSDYYSTGESGAVFSRALGEHILFTDHSLATDAAFAEVQLISCRNVFIYFDQKLRDRAVALFRDALCPRGFLGLGAKETLPYSPHASAFEPFAERERIYRLRRERNNERSCRAKEA
jgi:chemotaxis protein methyltransferase CheR